MRRRELIWGATGLVLARGPASAAVEPGAPPAVARYEAATGGRAGFWAGRVEDGRSLGWRADERFVMCSTFKASLAALVLARVERGEETLAARAPFGPADVPDWHAPVARARLAVGAMSVEELCAGAVEESDNTCANLLLARSGGPRALTAFWRSLGDGVSRLDAVEPELNRTPPGGVENTTTPRAMARTLGRLTLGPALSQAGRAWLVGWLLGCRTGADRLRAGLPADWRTGDKTGSNGRDAAGDIALTGPAGGPQILVAAYTRGGAPTPADLRSLFEGIGRHVAERLGSA